MLLWALIVLKDFFLRNWWVQNHCIYIYLEPCTCKSFKLHSNTLYWIVYLNVVVHIVTVSNIIHVGRYLHCTFEIMSRVNVISFCREIPKSLRGIQFMHSQVTVGAYGKAGIRKRKRSRKRNRNRNRNANLRNKNWKPPPEKKSWIRPWYVWKCEVVVHWIYARVSGGTAWADSEEYVLRWSVHSGWYERNGMLLTINQFLGSFSVPDSRNTNSPFFWIQPVTDVVFPR